MAFGRRLELLENGVGELVGADGERRRDRVEPPRRGLAGRLLEAQAVAGTTAGLAIGAVHGDLALPGVRIVVALDELDFLWLAHMLPERGEAVLVFLGGKDVRVGVVDREVDALLREDARRLERARAATGMQEHAPAALVTLARH